MPSPCGRGRKRGLSCGEALLPVLPGADKAAVRLAGKQHLLAPGVNG